MNADRQLQVETAAARQMRDVLLTMADGDGQLIADMIEGTTNLHEAIKAVLAEITEAELMATGLDVTIEALQARATRYQRRIERMRAAIEKGMQAGELTKLELPEATISLRHVPPKLEVASEAAIPEQFFIPQPAKLDKKALADALKSGAEVPGARMSNCGQSLTIRRA